MGRRFFFKRLRQLPAGPVMPLLPVINPLQAVNPFYLLLNLQPVVRHGLNELTATNTRHVLFETAMIAYLMGVGYDYRTAMAIVESWELAETLKEGTLLLEQFQSTREDDEEGEN